MIHSLNFFTSFHQHFHLILQMVKREIIDRYRGSFLGMLWTFVTPILMLAIYTFVFSFVFKARWGGVIETTSNQYEFALVLFTGLIIFNLFADCIGRAPNLILNNVNYVKKVIFPLEILPLVSLGSALFNSLTSLFILMFFLIIQGHTFHLSVLWLPIIILPFLLLVIGLSWFLAATGVFIRDIGQIINMILTVLMFLCPIFYPLSALPEELRGYLYLNPLTLMVEQVRAVLIWGQQPNWLYMGYYALFSSFIAILGWIWFQKTRKGFADVL